MKPGAAMITVSLIISLLSFTAEAQPAPLQGLLNNPESVVYDPPRCRYLVSNWSDGNIIAIDSLGNQTYFNTEMDQAAGLHIVENTIYAASTEGTITGIIGFDLETGTRIFTLDIPEKVLLNDITSDGSEYLYVTDCEADRIYTVRLSDLTCSVLVDSGLGYPNGILYDENAEKLLVLNGGLSGRPLLAVNLADTSLSVVVETGLNAIDGLTTDNDGYTYFSSWFTDKVYRYDSEFTNPAEIVSEGHYNPADIFINTIDDILAVPNFNGNTVDLIPLLPQSSPGGGTVRGEISLTIQPNPFRNEIAVTYQIPSCESVDELSIFGLDGRLIRTFPDAGEFGELTWMGIDDNGNTLPPGVYIIVIRTSDEILTQQILKLN
ncbi:MAG: T9SS type A sorting domain-containing protein [Candidatus Fermentibacteria bacterium]